MTWRRLPTPVSDGPGLGDVVAAVTTALGLPPCGGCKDRQAALNAVTPAPVRALLAHLPGMPQDGPGGVGGAERPTESPGAAPRHGGPLREDP